MATTEIDHDHAVWVRSSADVAPVEDLWPVDEDALEDLARRRRHGRPVRVAGWACILALTGYAAWLGMAAAPRQAIVAWGTMGFVAPSAKATASPASTSTSPLVDHEPVAAAAVVPPPTATPAVMPAVAADAGAPAAEVDAGAVAAVADAGALAAEADAGVAGARPPARRVFVKPAYSRPKPAAVAAEPQPAPPIPRDLDDPYESVTSPKPSAIAPTYEPSEP